MDGDISSVAAAPQSLEQKLAQGAARIDVVMADDRRFFERQKHRNHRLRPAAQIELEQREIVDGSPLAEHRGARWFTIVKQLVPGARLRRLVALNETLDPDVLSERQCEWLFDHVG
jgi:hypothetical protein